MLDLDFSHGLAFSDEVYRHSGITVHPMKHHRPFIMVISFGRHVFRLSTDTVAAALESVIGGSAIEFRSLKSQIRFSHSKSPACKLVFIFSIYVLSSVQVLSASSTYGDMEVLIGVGNLLCGRSNVMLNGLL